MSSRAKLFDIRDGEVFPTEHCYAIYQLKHLIDHYQENAGRVLACIHYYISLNPEDNPFAYLPEEGRWAIIVTNVCPELLDVHDDLTLRDAIDICKELYETTEYKMYKAFKTLMDKLVTAIEGTNPNLTRDSGNMGQIKEAVKSYKDLKAAYKESFDEYMKTFNSNQIRGNMQEAYDSDYEDEDDE